MKKIFKIQFFFSMVLLFLCSSVFLAAHAADLTVSGCAPEAATTCGAWSNCIEASQSRACSDACTNTTETRSCAIGSAGLSASGCTPGLEKCQYSECINTIQIRTCDNSCTRSSVVRVCGTECSDGIDNDFDGLVDFPNDPGCFSESDTKEADPIFLFECSDGRDNDFDGHIDYPNDSGCESASDDFEDDTKKPQCLDGHDNDGDGFIDYPQDAGCDNANDSYELDILKPHCSDGIDNDHDGLVDYPDDQGCVNAIDSDERDGVVFACNDGLDNDSDGYIDYPHDPGCDSVSDNDEATPRASAQCFDGIDNDKDGFVDYPNDPDCLSANDNNERAKSKQEMKQCHDGIDNDLDGKIDFPRDSGCLSFFDNSEESPQILPQCSDFIDNDNDGLVDFPHDPECVSASSDNEYALTPPPACIDGKDNDGDGLIDFPFDTGCDSQSDISESNVSETLKEKNIVGFFVEFGRSIKRTLGSNPIAREVYNVTLGDVSFEKKLRNIFMPFLIVVASALSLSSITPSILMNFLKNVPRASLGMLGVRLKKGGRVYDIITLQPIEFAEITVYDNSTLRYISSTITDKKGRYHLTLPAGNYYIKLKREGYDFPSHSAKDYKHNRQGGAYEHQYFGTGFSVDENENTIRFNIPLDRHKKEFSDKKIIKNDNLQKIRLNYLALVVVFSGLIFTSKISPIYGAYFGVSILFYWLFKRLGYIKKPRAWGRVYDAKTKKVISNAVVKIYDSRNNIMVDSCVTDRKGRYGLHAENNIYYIHVSKLGYGTEEIDEIDLLSRRGKNIKNKHVSLQKHTL